MKHQRWSLSWYFQRSLLGDCRASLNFPLSTSKQVLHVSKFWTTMCQQVFLLKASFEAIFNFEQESFHIRKLGALEHWSWWLGNCGTDTIFIKEQNSIDLSLNIQPRNYLLASTFSPLRYDVHLGRRGRRFPSIVNCKSICKIWQIKISVSKSNHKNQFQ